MTSEEHNELTVGITSFLTNGGLLNPELMLPERARDLLIKCRTALDTYRDEIEGLRKDVEFFKGQFNDQVESREAAEAKLAEARAEVNEHLNKAFIMAIDKQTAEAERDRLAADNARLVEIVKHLIDAADALADATNSCMADEAILEARAALETVKGA